MVYKRILKLKNFLKISIAILLAFASSNTFASNTVILRAASPDWINTDKCDCEEYQTTSDDNITEFFSSVQPIDGEFHLARTTNSSISSTVDISSVEELPSDAPITHLKIESGKTAYFKPGSALTMGCGSKVTVNNAKLYLAGDIRSEKTSTIEIGNKDSKTGGYFIINAQDPLYISGLTINLNDNKSHLEVHGTDISFTDCVINLYDKDATLHMHNDLFKNAKFNPEVVELY